MKTTFKDVLGTDAPAGRIVKRIAQANRTGRFLPLRR